ncbi:hypothetical protein HMPREF9083_0287 [Dialister micraerophilus DSM 19965]|uniref:Uncharacterized protein n=1 Tax=Dialister micraerophilus DSM 19965 TaxID=888062 RepID=F2BVQ6_9FIRM|nr:hypothetical protein HMPREF9083_0287 [Dialister micraerophilus DSM 19965]
MKNIFLYFQYLLQRINFFIAKGKRILFWIKIFYMFDEKSLTNIHNE